VCSAGLPLVGGQGGSLLAYQLQVNQALAEGRAPSLPRTRLLTSGGNLNLKSYIFPLQTERVRNKKKVVQFLVSKKEFESRMDWKDYKLLYYNRDLQCLKLDGDKTEIDRLIKLLDTGKNMFLLLAKFLRIFIFALMHFKHFNKC
jgi:hypothetical protein